eukprot:1160071-Pelagomonas_calceolata.AAC.11
MIPAKSKDHEIACSSNAMRVMCSISYKDAPVHTINTLRTVNIDVRCMKQHALKYQHGPALMQMGGIGDPCNTELHCMKQHGLKYKHGSALMQMGGIGDPCNTELHCMKQHALKYKHGSALMQMGGIGDP